jgi:ribonuclease BN (tRNA processing enzyme)
VVAYSGDTTPCAGLSELARESATLVVECNGRHAAPGAPTSHMDEDSVRALQAEHPDVHLVLTHIGEQVDLASLPGVTVPDDFSRLTV